MVLWEHLVIVGLTAALQPLWSSAERDAMSAETVGARMPTQVTLEDLAAMAAADENHRYELSPEGVLSVAPPADPDHALLVSRIFVWFVTHGYGPEQVVADCGIDVGGGRGARPHGLGGGPADTPSSIQLCRCRRVAARHRGRVQRIGSRGQDRQERRSTPRPASRTTGSSSGTAVRRCTGTRSMPRPASTRSWRVGCGR